MISLHSAYYRSISVIQTFGRLSRHKANTKIRQDQTMADASSGTSLTSAESRRLKVLLSPCHYIFDQQSRGSEISWAFHIGDAIGRSFPGSVVVTGRNDVRAPKPYWVVQAWPRLQKLQLEPKKAFIFALRCFLVTNLLSIKQRFHIVHHVLPFGIDRTVDLHLLFAPKMGRKFVIGPIQGSLTWADRDIVSEDVTRRTGKTKMRNRRMPFSKVFLDSMALASSMTLRRADALIAVNGRARDILLERGVHPHKIFVIPPGVDTQRFAYLPFDRKRHDHFELLSVGYLLERKGVDLLIRALPEIVANRDIILRIIGDGPQYQALEALSKKLGVSDMIVFEGLVSNSQVAMYYQQAHLFVSMSRSEIMAQMYVEAMACGLPIVASKNETTLEVVQQDYHGYLVEQEDYHALAERVTFLLDNAQTMSDFGFQARKTAQTEYDWENAIIPQYLEVYQRV